MPGSLPITIAIPTYRREQVLVDTIESLLRLEPRAGELLVVDQTFDHSPAVSASLAKWSASGEIRWLRLPRPSIPAAMNQGLVSARFAVVLFLDDDIVPFPDLVRRSRPRARARVPTRRGSRAAALGRGHRRRLVVGQALCVDGSA